MVDVDGMGRSLGDRTGMEMLKQIDGYADTSAPQLSYHWYTGTEPRHRILVCFEMPNGNLFALLFRLE